MSKKIIKDGLKEQITEFLEEHYDEDIQELENTLSETIEIDFEKLNEFSSIVADDLADSPDMWMYNAKSAIEDYDEDLEIEKPRILLRNYSKYNPAIRDLRDKHLGKVIRIDGTVSKATRILQKADVAAFECKRCGTITKVKQPLDTDLQYPNVCSAEDCDARREHEYRVNPNLSKIINFRKIEIQEPPEEVSGGQTPEKETFTVKGEIADNITAGDNVTAIGIYKAAEQSGKTSVFRTYIKGNNIIPEEKEFEEIEITDEEVERIQEIADSDDVFDQIRDSIAPNLYELEKEKEAIMYQLFRGVRKDKLEGNTIRGDIHVLFCGDPGTGKTLDKRSIIIDKNGNHKKIGDFVEDLMDNPTVDDDGDLIQEIKDRNVEVMGMDKDGEIEPREVNAIWKKNKPETTFEVKLSDGREITTSGTHPLFTPDGDAHIQQEKVNEIGESQFVAVPRSIDYEGTYELDALESYTENKSSKRLNTPDKWTESLAEMLGLIIGVGTVTDKRIKIENNDEELLEVFEKCVNSLGLQNVKRRIDERSNTPVVAISSVNLVNLLEEIDGSVRNKSRNKRVPKPIFSSPENIRKSFIRTYVDGEARISSQGNREVAVSSMSKELLSDVQRLLDSIGIYSQLNERRNESVEGGVSYNLRIYGKQFEKYIQEIGFVSERKQNRAVENIGSSGNLNSNVDVIPGVQDVVTETRKLLGMAPSDFESSVINEMEYENKNPRRESLKRLVRDMVGRLQILRGFEEVENSELTWSTVDEYRKFASLSQKEVAQELGYSLGWYRDRVEYDKTDSQTQKTMKAYESIKQKIDSDLHQAHQNLIRLESLAWGDIRWVEVESVEEVESDDEWMYDIEVEGTHNYVANGIMSHNSQLLRYASKLAPRSIMTSGKGSSSAGLTAAAVRDSEFGGNDKWTLQAGALVIADQGLACVDEIDKMSEEDRSSMHEGLEQQTISVAKAGINATLKSRCTLLAAANPKDGRWNEFDPVAEQIDLEPALVSRFDMIFAPEDNVEEDRDRMLSDHILTTNLRGQQLQAGIEPDDESDSVVPDIPPDLFKKYVAYSRKNCKPVMTEDAKNYLEEFFVNIRQEGQQEGAIPVTARKIEGLVRISEAAARIELSDRVEREHAERAERIVMESLKDVGYDEEAGRFDVDMTETNQSSSQRDRRNQLIEVIEDNEDEGDAGAPRELVIEIMTEEYGYEQDKIEFDLNKLGRDGEEIYEPQTNEYATM